MGFQREGRRKGHNRGSQGAREGPPWKDLRWRGVSAKASACWGASDSLDKALLYRAVRQPQLSFLSPQITDIH